MCPACQGTFVFTDNQPGSRGLKISSATVFPTSGLTAHWTSPEISEIYALHTSSERSFCITIRFARVTYVPVVSAVSPDAIGQMYMVGAHVITTLSGVPFTEFVQDRILKPLRMTHSTYSINEAIRSGKASETWTPFGRRIPSWMEGAKTELLAGPSGLISNVRELVCVAPVQAIVKANYSKT